MKISMASLVLLEDHLSRVGNLLLDDFTIFITTFQSARLCREGATDIMTLVTPNINTCLGGWFGFSPTTMMIPAIITPPVPASCSITTGRMTDIGSTRISTIDNPAWCLREYDNNYCNKKNSFVHFVKCWVVRSVEADNWCSQFKWFRRSKNTSSNLSMPRSLRNQYSGHYSGRWTDQY